MNLRRLFAIICAYYNEATFLKNNRRWMLSIKTDAQMHSIHYIFHYAQ
jgi:hypothetical protein